MMKQISSTTQAGSLLARLAVLLISLILTAGCGGSSDDGFVFTGTNNNPGAQAGAVTFNFVKVQAALEVPQATTDLRFRFFDGPNATGALVQEEFREFAASITINPVTAAAESVVVTAYDANGVPLLESTANITIVVGGNIAVDFANATTVAVVASSINVGADTTVAVGATRQFTANVTYSNGDVVAAPGVTWASDDASATINANTGLATGVANGNAVITGTLGALSDSANLTVGTGFVPVLTTLTVTPDGDTVATNGTIQFSVTGADQNGDPFTLDPNSVVWSAAAGTGNATIDASTGLATGTLEGTATITATVGAVSDSAALNVIDVPGDVTGIVSIAPSPLNLALDPMDNNTTGTLVTTGSFQNGPDAPLDNATHGLTYVITGNPGVVTVDNAGNVTAVAQGSTVITATVGLFTDTVTVNVAFGTVGNQNPVVTVDTGELVIEQNAAALAAFPTTTVTDDQANLSGGTLTIGIANGPSDVLFDVTDPTPIGVVTGDGTSAISVALDVDATPAAIQTFLQAVTVTSATGAALGEGAFNVALSDGQGGSDNTNNRDFLVIGAGALNLTVGASGNDFTTFAAAITEIQTNGAPNSVITADVDYANEGTVSIINHGNLVGLRLRGNNAGITAGALPFGQTNPTRNAETVVDRFTVDNSGVTIDGFALNGDGSRAVSLEDEALNFTLANSVLDNANALPNANRGVVYEAGGASPSGATIRDNYFSDWNEAVRLTPGSGEYLQVVMTGNIFENNNIGAAINLPDAPTITGNSFLNATSFHLAVQLETATGDASANANDFTGTGAVAVFSATTGTLNATNNWWGQAGGPLGGQTSLNGAGAAIDATSPAAAAFTNYP